MSLASVNTFLHLESKKDCGCEEEEEEEETLTIKAESITLYMSWEERLQTKRRTRGLTESDKKRVAASQHWRCADCLHLLDAAYQIDHIVPVAVGGTDAPSNLQALCLHCHVAKTTGSEQEKIVIFRQMQQECEGRHCAPCWHCGAVYSLFFPSHSCSPSIPKAFA